MRALASRNVGEWMKVAVVFPGQGSQSPDMLDAWLEHPASAAVIDEASRLLGEDIVAACKAPGALERTDVTQLGVFTCDVAAWRVLEAHGVVPAAAAGHSLGEFAALVAAGAAGFAPAFEAVRARARAMQEACTASPGTMLALIGLSRDDAAAVCAEAAQGDHLVIANENSPNQTVLSGTPEAVERAAAAAKAKRGHAVRIPVAGAFHSPLMAPALGTIAAAISKMDLAAPRFPIVENVSAEPTKDPATLEDLLCRHVVSPVRWAASVDAMREMGVAMFVEAGPGDVLSRLNRRCSPDAEAVAVNTPDDAAALADKISREEPDA